MNASLYFEPDWPAPAGVRAACSLRGGGVSVGPWQSLNLGDHVGDDPAHVGANRRRLREALGLSGEPMWLNQVHGVEVVRAEHWSGQARADASVSTLRGAVCAVLTADCLPVLFADFSGTRVAAAHAGWRGLAGGVLEQAVAALGVPPGDILAWLGPAIGPSAFEVGEEVRAAFARHHAGALAHFRANTRGRWQADLFGLARQRLALAGVSRVYGGEHCTASDPQRFFSYRRDGQCGRMASLVWLE